MTIRKGFWGDRVAGKAGTKSARFGCCLVAAALGFGSLLPVSIHAETSEKIAIVDVQQIVNESIIGKAAKKNVEQQINKAKLRVASLKSDFEKQRADLEKQSSILSGAALEQRREALAKKQVDFQRTYQDMQQELGRANDKELGKVIEQVNEVVKDLADERGYQFVFEKDKQSVLYAAPRIDITKEVIESLDKKKLDL
jgi:outer membrane protein